MTTTSRNRTSAPPPPVRSRRKRVEPIYYAFLIPALLLFTIAIPIPGIIGILFSFTDSIGIGSWNFIGFINYRAVFDDPAIVASFLFTFGFTLATVVVVNVIALLLAIGLTSRIRFTVALRTVFVIPMVVSGIIIAFVFQFLFQNSLPGIGSVLGIPFLETNILANPDLAWVGIVIVTAWQAIPGSLIIYIAGLLSIPPEMHDAASVDGASTLQQMFKITLPLIAGYVLINVILGFKNFLNAYDIIVGLTAGGPGTSTRSIAMTIITGFETGDYAYQMATATLFFIITVVIAVLQLSVARGGRKGTP